MFAKLLLATALAAPLVGCGLIDADVTQFDLGLPDKQFTVDAGNWGLSNPEQYLSQQCTTSPDPCAQAAMQACRPGQCVGMCNPGSHTCDLTLFVSLYQGIDLVTEKPELQSINDEPIIDVTIDSIDYQVTANTLNVPTPEMGVWAAPATVMVPGDPGSKRVGTVPSVPAGATLPTTSMVFDPSGKDNLKSFMGSYKTPFNIVVGSGMTLHQNSPVPQGAMTVKVSIAAHAGL
ncbi:MAG TPA: hypothetical protein VHE35_03055 [Kofleriaceae bacterium]|nr:hypothetical protein [Kofleriaceae bacterium]